MYNYEEEKPYLFTDAGQRDFLKVRDNVKRILKIAGCARMQEAISGMCGSTWHHLAMVDRLVELGEIRELEQKGGCAGQDRIFISTEY